MRGDLARDGVRVGEVEAVAAAGVDVVAARGSGLRHGLAEHPAGACDEDPHRIPMSELSPTRKR